MYKTQNQQVLDQLERHGSVTRNWALNRGMTRLAARIIDLKNAGYKFLKPRRIVTDTTRDYEYILLTNRKYCKYCSGPLEKKRAYNRPSGYTCNKCRVINNKARQLRGKK